MEIRHGQNGDGDAGHAPNVQAQAEAVARRGYGRLLALLAARTQDLQAAEDALADAFAAALLEWPRGGVPANPEAWLLTVARRKLIDAARRRATGDAVAEQLRYLADEYSTIADQAEIPDRRLALMFVCAHPAIESGIRAPLMLQAVLGLDAATIASAFLIAPSAMGKRLVRAKQKIRQAGIPFVIPGREELPARLGAVLDAIYAAFAEGWADPLGTDTARRDLTAEAIVLARLVAGLMPNQPEALALLALMLHAEARRGARRNARGEYVPLAEQDVDAWDWALIAHAEQLLRRAGAFGTVGRYGLEAALQSAHVARRRTGLANWDAVVQLYDALVARTGSPVAMLNRALAIAELHGAAAGLDALAALDADARLVEYQPYWAARADLLARSLAFDAARAAYDIAIGLERDPAVRRFLQKRREALPE